MLAAVCATGLAAEVGGGGFARSPAGQPLASFVDEGRGLRLPTGHYFYPTDSPPVPQVAVRALVEQVPYSYNPYGESLLQL